MQEKADLEKKKVYTGLHSALRHCPGASEDLLLIGIQKFILRPVQRHDVSSRGCFWVLRCGSGTGFPAGRAAHPCRFSPEVLCILQKGVSKMQTVSPPQKEL